MVDMVCDGSLLPSSKHQKGFQVASSPCRDVISSLPDHILVHILSFLSTKHAIRTCTLSRRWQALWTQQSNFVFDFDSCDTCSNSPLYTLHLLDSFCLLLDRVFLTRHGLCLQKFTLKLWTFVPEFVVSKWIVALIQHKVQELDLYFPGANQCPLPQIFTSEILCKLKLQYYMLKRLDFIHLPSLAHLTLGCITFHDEATVERLLSSCPVLQELTLSDCVWDYVKKVNIVVPSLQTFIFDNSVATGGDNELLNCEIKIYAENLEHFCFTGHVTVKLLLCNLSSLDYACIGTDFSSWGEDERKCMSDLISGICGAKSLNLSDDTIELLFLGNPEVHVPTFNNLTHLKVESKDVQPDNFCSEAFMFLLNKCPNLESLGIDCAFFPGINRAPKITKQCVKSCLKIFSLRCFKGTATEMEFLKHLCEVGTVLCKVEIFCTEDPSTLVDQELIRKQLQGVRKGLRECIVEFI